MESCKLGLAEQTVEYMTHFVEECHNVVVAHECWLIRSRLGQVGDHGSHRIAALSVRMVVASQKWPDSGMRVFSSFMCQ